MKRYLFSLAAMLLGLSVNVSAGDKVIFIKRDTPIIRPKSPQLHPIIIVGEYDQGMLAIDVTGYDGDATITVLDATMHQVVSTTDEAIVSPDTVYVDLSALSSSTYYIFIKLGNGDFYYATIQI